MALDLPFPGIVFVPLDMLTAERQNQIVANYTYIASQFPLQTSSIDWENLTYEVGEQISFGTYNLLPGCITDSNKQIQLTINLPRRLKTPSDPSATYSITFDELTVRGIGGYILSSVPMSGLELTLSISASNWTGNNHVRLDVRKSGGAAFSGATNNTPVTGTVSNMVITRVS